MKNTMVLFVLLGALTAGAQPGSAVPKNIRAANTLDNLFDANGVSTTDNFYGIPLEPGEVRGNAYLHPGWRRTTFMLYEAEKMIEGYDARYAIDHDQFEIRTTRGVKVLDGAKVKSFVWMDSATHAPHFFMNARDLKLEDGAHLSGFVQVLVEGEFTLLSKTRVLVKDPTYNEKFDMGQRDIRILKKTEYYYLHEDVIRAIPLSQKKFFSIFGQHADDIANFVKVNRLSVDEAGHLTSIFLRYNSLTVTN